MTGDAVRRMIGLCDQQPHLFDNTIAENVRLAKPGASDEQVARALSAAGAGPWIASLPRGIETAVGRHGTAVSGGQRQRIALARILLARPPIAVFDEPTEHLDPDSASALMSDLLAATEGQSVIVISHLLVDLAPVDHVIVLEGGRVAEEGSPRQLLGRDTWFSRQHDRQLRSGRSGSSLEESAAIPLS